MNWNTPKGRLLKVFLIFIGILADYGIGTTAFYFICLKGNSNSNLVEMLLLGGILATLFIDILIVAVISICDNLYKYIKYGTTDEDEIEAIQKEANKSAVDLDYLTAEKELNMFLAKNKE